MFTPIAYAEFTQVGQLLPALHLHDGGRDAGDERTVRGRGDLRHLADHLDVRRRVIEVVIADEGAEGLATKLAVLRLVELLEDRALVPRHALEALERPTQVGLRDVHHA